jgi:hypothetical protein
MVPRSRFPRKFISRSPANYARSMGKHTMHSTKDYHRHEKEGKAKASFCAAKKAGKKPNSAKQSFAQLSN